MSPYVASCSSLSRRFICSLAVLSRPKPVVSLKYWDRRATCSLLTQFKSSRPLKQQGLGSGRSWVLSFGSEAF